MQAQKRIRRGVVTAVAAIALCAGLAALPAAAQPGPHNHGEHFMQHLAAVKSQLNLNTSQQGMWDAVVTAGKSAREAARARRDTVRQLVAAEAAKPAGAAPDLGAIALATDKVQQANITDRHAVRDQWLTLYGTFNSDQVAVVKGLLSQRLARMDSFRERMQRHFGKS